MKCVLHIGTEKTGTTLLQDWLFENRDELSRQRVYLPTTLGKKNHRLFPAFFQRKLDDWATRMKVRSEADKEKLFAGFSETFAQEVSEARKHHDVFIITSEQLHSRIEDRETVSRIKDFLDRHFTEMTIICYFRDQADMAVSLYSTALKGSEKASLDQFLSRTVTADSPYYNFKDIADRWGAVFGQEHCVFKPYDRASFDKGDLRLDFLKSLPQPVDPSSLSYDTTSSNESLPPLVATAFRQINTHVPYWTEAGGMSKLNARLKWKVSALESLQTGKLDSPRKPAIRDMFMESNAAFLAQYLPPGAQLAASPPQPVEQRMFSLQEVEAILENTLSALLPILQPEPTSSLLGSDADHLRDIAVKIEQGTAPSLQDAAALMNLALRARPKGQLIRKKVEDYAARLKQTGGA